MTEEELAQELARLEEENTILRLKEKIRAARAPLEEGEEPIWTPATEGWLCTNKRLLGGKQRSCGWKGKKCRWCRCVLANCSCHTYWKQGAKCNCFARGKECTHSLEVQAAPAPISTGKGLKWLA